MSERENVALEIYKGVAGEAVYLDGHRIAGPSDNGRMTLVKKWTVPVREVGAALGLVKPSFAA